MICVAFFNKDIQRDKEMADALYKIDPDAYKMFKRPDGSVYVQLKKPLYGLIEAAKLWIHVISRTEKKEKMKQSNIMIS